MMNDGFGLTDKFQTVAYRFLRGEEWYWNEGIDPKWMMSLVDDGYAIMATRRDKDRFTLLVKAAKNRQ